MNSSLLSQQSMFITLCSICLWIGICSQHKFFLLPVSKRLSNCFGFFQSLQTPSPPSTVQLIFPRSGSVSPFSHFIWLANHAIKVLERCLLLALEGSLRLADSQHGFCKIRSATSALLSLNQNAAAGFNKKELPFRTGQWQSTLRKPSTQRATEKLIEAISVIGLEQNIMRWLVP